MAGAVTSITNSEASRSPVRNAYSAPPNTPVAQPSGSTPRLPERGSGYAPPRSANHSSASPLSWTRVPSVRNTENPRPPDHTPAPKALLAVSPSLAVMKWLPPANRHTASGWSWPTNAALVKSIVALASTSARAWIDEPASM